MQFLAFLLKVAPGVILWSARGAVAGIVGFVAAFVLTWLFAILTLRTGSIRALRASRFWIGPVVFVVVLGCGLLMF
jgi:hypothetical protein